MIENFPFCCWTIFTLRLLADGMLERANMLVDGGKGSTNSVAFPALNYVSSQEEMFFLSFYLSWTVGTDSMTETGWMTVTGWAPGSSVVWRGDP